MDDSTADVSESRRVFGILICLVLIITRFILANRLFPFNRFSSTAQTPLGIVTESTLFRRADRGSGKIKSLRLWTRRGASNNTLISGGKCIASQLPRFPASQHPRFSAGGIAAFQLARSAPRPASRERLTSGTAARRLFV